MQEKTEAVREIHGQLFAWFETGTEGIYWAVVDDEKKGYDGLHVLENGNVLTVFNKENKKKILFQGTIALEYDRLRRALQYNPEYFQQCVLGYWVHGLQKDVDPEKWAHMFFDEHRAVLKK